jgi:FtsP/CotA-like multicopper oxidase with cupredoxin domain
MRSSLLLALGTLFASASLHAQATYTLKPTPKTVAWGYYDAKAAPVLRVKSGDTIEIQTLITNSPKRLEDACPRIKSSNRCVTLPIR